MTHYICLVCGGVSEEPGICQTDHCEHKGMELVPCECDKKEHLEKLISRNPSSKSRDVSRN